MVTCFGKQGKTGFEDPSLALQDLAKPDVKIVLADKTVPTGQCAQQFLMNVSADPAFGSSYEACAGYFRHTTTN